MLKRLYGFLRSRRLAIWLIVGIVAYVLVMTAFPRDGIGEWRTRYGEDVARIARTLRIVHPYSNPLFILASILLTASTAACSWERSGRAIRTARTFGRVSAALRDRVTTSPTRVFRVQEADTAVVLGRASTALGSMRMRVKSGPSLLEARGNALGLLGSPLFHWSLALLFTVAGLGQLTRSEGVINLPLTKAQVAESHDSYVETVEGPLFGERHTGALLAASGFEPQTTYKGVARGPSAVVTVSDGALQKTQRVFPNRPLRHRSLMIQRSDYGPLLLADFTAGQRTDRIPVYFPGKERGPASGVADLSINTTTGVTDVRIEVLKGKRVGVKVRPPGVKGFTLVGSAGEGDTLDVLPGYTLSPREFASYFQVTITNDWSVPFIYAFFALALLGGTLALLLVPRRVLLMARSGSGGTIVDVLVLPSRLDPAFPLRCMRVLEAAFPQQLRSPDEDDDGGFDDARQRGEA